ncbi:ShlB/FhaC/HecB family hemolysin secretion/activation protein [Geothermobacter ehrlichii]|nr:ShlB/FhaC/HecB family hemolysin secretion/activation protein [Geothermobacter ehrlichii]
MLLLLVPTTSALAAVTDTASEEQRLRQQREYERRQVERTPPASRLEREVEAVPFELPAEERCFVITEPTIAIPAALQTEHPETADLLKPGGKLAFLQEAMATLRGRCVGVEGINRLVRHLTSLLLEAGYTTTRVGIPAQNLAPGRLRLELIPGRLRAIRVEGVTGPFSTAALPLRPGDLIDIRALEQGLEQMQLPSRDVRLDLLPGDRPGESDLLIHVRQNRPWRLSLTLDNTGSRATGPWRTGTTLKLDSPFAHSGQLDLDWTGTPGDVNRHRAENLRLAYSLPLGWWRLGIDLSRDSWRQTVAGINQDFTSSGESRRFGVFLSRTLSRDRQQKLDIDLSLATRSSRGFIEDVEIGVQRRRQTDLGVGLRQTVRFGQTLLYWKLTHRRGMPWFGARRDFPGRQPEDPTFFYRLQTFDLNLEHPWQAGPLRLNSQVVLHVQYSATPLFTADQIAIGGPWTVRGFDGEQTLSAERGFFARGETELDLPRSWPDLFAGLDYGRVGGPSAAVPGGQELAGAVVGLRGRWNRLGLEAFAGWPLKKPDRLRTAQPAVTVRMSWGI